MPRNRIGHGSRRRCDRQPEPPQVVVLIVVTIPAAMVLFEMNRQDRAPGEDDRFIQREDRLARLVAPAGTVVNSPGRFALAVDRHVYRTGHPLLATLVIKDRLERRDRRVDVSSGLREFDRDRLALSIRRRRLDSEFGESRRSL